MWRLNGEIFYFVIENYLESNIFPPQHTCVQFITLLVFSVGWILVLELILLYRLRDLRSFRFHTVNRLEISPFDDTLFGNGQKSRGKRCGEYGGAETPSLAQNCFTDKIDESVHCVDARSGNDFCPIQADFFILILWGSSRRVDDNVDLQFGHGEPI